MKRIARSLRPPRELILNYFRAQKPISRGVVEGLNNKAKASMRKSYGFRTFRVLELALYHSLGKLPEPESIHDFFRRVIERLVKRSPKSYSRPIFLPEWTASSKKIASSRILPRSARLISSMCKR